MVFGRKGVSTPQPPASSRDGRQWIIDKLAPTDQPGSMEHAHARGLKLFDDAYNIMKNERGARIEDMAAMLGSVGGHLCLTAVLGELASDRMSRQDIDMALVEGRDGHAYYFGDAPNWLLCEAPYSLISLLFGAASEYGAPVSLEMLQADMALVAQRVGTPQFLDLELPHDHEVASPVEWARQFAPFVRNSVFGGMAPPVRLPVIVGFALQQAVEVGRQSLDPMLIATIAMKCAMRAAKIDPERMAA